MADCVALRKSLPFCGPYQFHLQNEEEVRFHLWCVQSSFTEQLPLFCALCHALTGYLLLPIFTMRKQRLIVDTSLGLRAR